MAVNVPAAPDLQRLKICILTETFHPVVGGGETQARALADGLANLGFETFVLTRRSHPSYARVDRLNALPVYRVGPSGSAHYKKWGLLLTILPILFKRRSDYDVLFVSGFRVVGLTAVLASHILRKHCILKADSLGEMSGRFFRGGLKRFGLKPSSFSVKVFLGVRNYVLRRADAFVAISSEVSAELLAAGVADSAIHAIPNSVPLTKFNPVDEQRKASLRVQLGLPARGKVVVFTGRLVSYKGLPVLLRAWRKVAVQNDTARLVLVGAGGMDIHNCESDLKSYVQQNGLQRSVHFVGAVENVQEYLQAADTFVFPTESEAFGISLIEAMACGLPVISTPIGGVRDIVSHDQNGLLVEVGDVDQLSETIQRLLNDDSLASRLGDAGRKTVVSRYSSDRVVRQYASLFSMLAGKRAENRRLSGDYTIAR